MICITDLDYLTEVVHSGGVFSGPDLRRASGQRGVGLLDRGAKNHAGDALLPLVDSVVSDILQTFLFILHPSSFILFSLVLAQPCGVPLGDAQQRISGRLAASAFGNSLVVAFTGDCPNPPRRMGFFFFFFFFFLKKKKIFFTVLGLSP